MENSVRTPNLEFLRSASDMTLEEYELARRNSAANLTRQVRVLLLQIVDDLADAELARLARDTRKELCLQEDNARELKGL